MQSAKGVCPSVEHGRLTGQGEALREADPCHAATCGLFSLLSCGHTCIRPNLCRPWSQPLSSSRPARLSCEMMAAMSAGSRHRFLATLLMGISYFLRRMMSASAVLLTAAMPAAGGEAALPTRPYKNGVWGAC